MTSWSIAPSQVVGHLGPFPWSDAAARDGPDACNINKVQWHMNNASSHNLRWAT